MCSVCALININKARQHLRKLRTRQKCRGRSDSNRTQYYEFFFSKSGFWESLLLCSAMCLSNSAQRGERNLGYWIHLPGREIFLFLDIGKKHITDIKASSLKKTQHMNSALSNFSLLGDLSFCCLSLKYCVAPGKKEIPFTIWKQLRCIFTSLWHLVIFPCLIFMCFTCSKDWISKQVVASWGGEGFLRREFCRAGQPLAHAGSLQG